MRAVDVRGCRVCGGLPKEDAHWDGWHWSVSVRCEGCGTGARAVGGDLVPARADAWDAWRRYCTDCLEPRDALRWAALACACVALGALGAQLGPVWGGVLMGAAACACGALSCLAVGGAR